MVRNLVVLRSAFFVAVFSLFACAAFAADHGDAPGVRFDTRLDINDVYIFQAPGSSANTVIIVTTNPLSGTISPTTYSSTARYEILIDQDGDSKPDLKYSLKFKKPDSSNVQEVTLFENKGNSSKGGKKLATGNTGSVISVNGGGSLQAGVFDDGFFFDLIAFKNGLSFSSTDPVNFFRGLNTNAIVLELASEDLHGKNGDSNIGVRARTVNKGKQVDRMGRPAINTVLISSANKDKFNAGQPVNDSADFRADAVAAIVGLGRTEADAGTLADTLLPDIMTFDASSTSGFLNGRKLEDDVIDAELALLTGNNAASDFVVNDSTFSSTFPYMGTKNP